LRGRGDRGEVRAIVAKLVGDRGMVKAIARDEVREIAGRRRAIADEGKSDRG